MKRDLNQVNSTFANQVQNDIGYLNAHRHDQATLLQWCYAALDRAFEAKHFNLQAYNTYKAAAEKKPTATSLLKFIFDMSLAGGGMSVIG